jgi:hypothetical protein
MVWVTRSSIRSPRYERVGSQALQLLMQPLRKAVEQCRVCSVVAQRGIRKAKQDRRMDSERLRSAAGLIAANARQFRTARNRCICPALGAICRDDRVDLRGLASVACDDRPKSVKPMIQGRRTPLGFSECWQRSKVVVPTTSNIRSWVFAFLVKSSLV